VRVTSSWATTQIGRDNDGMLNQDRNRAQCFHVIDENNVLDENNLVQEVKAKKTDLFSVREDVFDLATSQHSGYVGDVFPVMENAQCTKDETTEMFFFDGLYKFDSINLDNYLSTARQTACDEELNEHSITHKSRAITILFRPNQAFYDAQRTYEFAVRNNIADVCQQGGDNCHAYATCNPTDSIPYYSCTCNTGYTGSGQYCVSDDDEMLIHQLTLRLATIHTTLNTYTQVNTQPLEDALVATETRMPTIESALNLKVTTATNSVDSYMNALLNGVDYVTTLANYNNEVTTLQQDLIQASADRAAADAVLQNTLGSGGSPSNGGPFTDLGNTETNILNNINALGLFFLSQIGAVDMTTPTFTANPSIDDLNTEIIDRIAAYGGTNSLSTAEGDLNAEAGDQNAIIGALTTELTDKYNTVNEEQYDGFSSALSTYTISGVIAFAQENADTNQVHNNGVFTSSRAYGIEQGFYLISFSMKPEKDVETKIVLYLDSTEIAQLHTSDYLNRSGRDVISMSTGHFIGEGQTLSIQLVVGGIATPISYGSANSFSAWLIFAPPPTVTLI
jgi:hypothetical protein